MIPHSRFYRFRHSLMMQNMLCTSIMVILVLGITAYNYSLKERQRIIENFKNASDMMLQVTAQALGYPLWNFDEVQAQETVEALKYTEGFCGVRVLDVDGNVLAQIISPRYKKGVFGKQVAHAKPAYDNSGASMNASPPQISGEPTIAGDSSRLYKKAEDVFFSDPTLDKPKLVPVGRLELCEDTTPAWDKIYRRENMLAAVVVSLMLGIVGINWFVLSIVMRPLARLRDLIRETKHGLIYITDKSLLAPNEVGELGVAFNSMMGDLSQTQEMLQHQVEEAKAANRAKSKFLSNMSHELRTPMHAILNYSEMGVKQLEKQDYTKVIKYLTNIHSAGKRLLGLVNDLLDLSKLEAGKMMLCMDQERLSEVVEAAQQELDALFQKKKLRFALHVETPDDRLVCDKAKLMQVCVNVFSNALKYSPEGAEVAVRIFAEQWRDKPHIRLSVLNEGPAIPEEDIEHIFALFVQSDALEKANGTGLGLAICREIVTAHYGEIWAENLSNNPEGKSVAFHIRFPVL